MAKVWTSTVKEMSLLWRPNDFFFSTHFRNIVWCIKSWTRLFLICRQLSGFLNSSVRGYKAENWHALSHEQYFSKNRFLGIFRFSFKKVVCHITLYFTRIYITFVNSKSFFKASGKANIFLPTKFAGCQINNASTVKLLLITAQLISTV